MSAQDRSKILEVLTEASSALSAAKQVKLDTTLLANGLSDIADQLTENMQAIEESIDADRFGEALWDTKQAVLELISELSQELESIDAHSLSHDQHGTIAEDVGARIDAIVEVLEHAKKALRGTQ